MEGWGSRIRSGMTMLGGVGGWAKFTLMARAVGAGLPCHPGRSAAESRDLSGGAGTVLIVDGAGNGGSGIPDQVRDDNVGGRWRVGEIGYERLLRWCKPPLSSRPERSGEPGSRLWVGHGADC